MNLILDTDSYKASHWKQYPPGTTSMFSYLESRGGKYTHTVFFGLQYLLKQLEGTVVTAEDVAEAKAFFEAHGEPFNEEGWMHIVNHHKGKLPVRIKAAPEGLVIPTHNCLMTVESTDPKVFWLVSWLETMLMRVWYPTTVATQSYHIKQLIKSYLERTCDKPDLELDFSLHDFGSRGVSSRESAGIGGCAHLVNFLGSDTVVGVACANKFYGTKAGMAGFSIPAAEHSTMTMWGREHEVDAYRNMIRQYGQEGKIFAVVSDSYDLYNAVENIWGKELKGEVLASGAVLVVRPDSGHPPTVVLRTMQLLEKQFGVSYNAKGFKVLNNVRVIQGDGINMESIRQILDGVKGDGFSAENVKFGMGGALLQKVDRDTQKFAFKCSHATVNGKNVDVFKDPITDAGKRSKRGKLNLVYVGGEYKTVEEESIGTVLKLVFENGEIKKLYTLDEVRRNASMTFAL
jgi:nicotinamide phosphoribosyltransferase